MKPSSRAMIWYFWKMSRRNILLFTALCPLATLFIWMTDKGPAASSHAFADFLVQGALIAVLGGGLFIWNTERSYLPNSSLLTLPLATSRYFILLCGYVTAVTGIFACAATILHLGLFGNELPREGSRVVFAFWQGPLVCIALANLYQSVGHLASIEKEFRVLPLLIVMIILNCLCVFPMLAPDINWGYPVEMAAGVTLLFAWACLYNALITQRNGRQRESLTALLDRLRMGRGRTQGFASPDRALFWLAWRRHARMFLIWTAALFVGAYLAGLVVFLRDYGKHSSANSFGVGTLLVLMLLYIPALISAAFLSNILSFIRDKEDLYGAGRGYFLTLPFRSVQFARGRLLAMTLSLALVLFVMVVIFSPFALISFNTHRALSDLVVPFLIISLTVWVVLWIGPASLLCSVLVLLPWFVHYLFRDPYVARALSLVMYLAWLLMSGAVFMSTHRRHLLDRTQINLLGFTFIPGVCASAYLVCFSTAPILWRLIGVIVPFYISLLFALPFVAVPLIIDRIRHR